MIQFNVQPNFGMHFQEYKYKYDLYDMIVVRSCINVMLESAPGDHQLRLENSSNPFGVPCIFTNKGHNHP